MLTVLLTINYMVSSLWETGNMCLIFGPDLFHGLEVFVDTNVSQELGKNGSGM